MRQLLPWIALLAFAACNPAAAEEPAALKAKLQDDKTSHEVLKTDAWTGFFKGYERGGETFVCDNGTDEKALRGVLQVVTLGQIVPKPVLAVASSKAENVSGKPDYHYCVYLDVHYNDGTHLWTQFAPFDVGTHDWQRKELLIVPEKPIASIGYFLVMRHHAGKVWFRDPQLRVAKGPHDYALAQSGDEPTIAVLDLVDKGPSVELAVLRTAFAEMLAGDLSQYQGIGVVERVRVDQFLREAHLQKGFTDAAAAQRAGQALAAEYLLTGSFSGKDETVSLDVSLFQLGEQEPILRWKQSGPVEKLSDMQQELAAKVLKTLAIDKPLRRPPPKPKPGPSPLVAVLALRNLSTTAKLDPMESGFAEVLQANLGALENVRLVERKKLYEILKEQKLTISGLVDPATVIKVGKLLGAERLIYGSFVQLNGNLHLNIRLADTTTSKILAAETAHGLLDNFADLIEDVSLRLAADLSIPPQENAAQLVKAATPTRKLEAVIHFTAAEQLFYNGDYEESAKAYERAILIDPKNPLAHRRRVRSLVKIKEYERAIEACEQAMDKNAVHPHHPAMAYIRRDLILCYRILGNQEMVLKLARQFNAESKRNKSRMRYSKAGVMRAAGDFDKATAKLELDVQMHKEQKNWQAYALALQRLHTHIVGRNNSREWLEYYQAKGNPEQMNLISEESKVRARRSLEVLDVLLDEAETHPGEHWRSFATGRAIRATAPRWVDEKRHIRRWAELAEQEERLARVLRVFSWVPQMCWEGHFQLARLREKLEKWPEAVEAYRYLVEHAQEAQICDPVSHTLGLTYRAPQHKLDEVIQAEFRISQIRLQYLSEQDQARIGFKQTLQRHGVIHHRDGCLISALDALGEEPHIREKAILVRGGSISSWQGWNEFMSPLGFSVHSVAQYNFVSSAELAPYELVVLAEVGQITHTPDEIMALRHYVATGGSLLIIISPGWCPSQPGIHNSLLSFFGVEASQAMTAQLNATPAVEHPITRGIKGVMAKCAVNLKAPAEASLIRAGDQTVLAAMPYRHGRVVVASLGQWFVPYSKLPDVGKPRSTSLARTVPWEKLPLATGKNLHLPLLKNVVAWLTVPHGNGNHGPSQRELFEKAHLVSLRAQFQAVPIEALTTAMDKLIETAEPGIWKEEALWAAGEASLAPLSYLNSGHLGREPPYHLKEYPRFPAPAAECYRRLIREFPDSPLAPYARWRLAYCKWNEAKGFAQYSSSYIQQPSHLPKAASLFQDVQAPEGSYPWAWSRLYLATVLFFQEDYQNASKNFKLVANRMEHGPEKALAILNAGLCYELLNDREEAIRYYKIALTIPNCSWRSPSQRIHWGPMKKNGWTDTVSSTNKYVAQKRLKALGATKGNW